ncbi:MAG: hypothetical protein ACI3Z8_07640 [Paludibacteraceae bacterium]
MSLTSCHCSTPRHNISDLACSQRYSSSALSQHRGQSLGFWLSSKPLCQSSYE